MRHEDERTELANKENIVLALQRMLEGQEFRIKIGDWELDNVEYKNIIELDYKQTAAVYAFLIRLQKTGIVLENFHREMSAQRQGIGTASLQYLEDIFGSLGQRLGKKVTITFIMTKRQQDTQAWLQKNGYTFNPRSGVFSKVL